MASVGFTELHRHLDISLRPGTLLEFAQESGIEPRSTSVEAFRQKILLTAPMRDLDSVLATFRLFQKVLDRPERLERVAEEVLEDCHREGIRRAELRFSPGFVCELSGLSWDDALTGFERGLKRGLVRLTDMKAGLICIATREQGPDAVDATVEFFLKHRTRFIGIDLAGSETAFPCRLFESSFKKAHAVGARITIHAGEASGPENVWEAIELLGAKRIGHGIRSIEDAQLMQLLADRGICLEICPTSNWITGCVPSLAAHPLPKLLRAGVPVSINTDDPGVFGVGLNQEYENCRNFLGLSQVELDLCNTNAFNSTFLPD